MADVAIGIDLGTTYSCIGYVKDGVPMVLPGPGGALTTPSIVCVDDRGNLIVGHQAKRRFLTHPQDTIYGAKRLVGRRFGTPEMKDIQSHFFYEISEGEDAEATIHAGGKTFKLEDVSAMIIGQLKDAAQEALGQKVTKAVISVPAYFTQRQREATKKAGELAGLEVLRIINEPTAAALAYGFGKKDRQKILVYDLGGGTFDVTALQLYEEVYEVVATGGDSFLGGIDFDNKIVRHFCEIVKNKYGIDIDKDKTALQRLRDASERAKIDLSSVEETEINLPFLAMGPDGKSVDFREKLSRATYNELVKPLVLATLKIVERTLREAGLEKNQLDEILFVGGMTRVPLVFDMVTKYFGKRPRKDVHPDEVVGLGAGILADAIVKGNTKVALADVLPVSIGIGVGKGEFRKIVNKNTTLPCEKIQMFRTTKDNQTSVAIRIYQGESRQVGNNEYLGELRLQFPPRPKGEIKVEIKFSVDQESILRVSAKDSISGKEMQAEFRTEAAVSMESYRADRLGDEAGEATRADGDGESAATSAKPSSKPTAASVFGDAPEQPGFFARLWQKLTGKSA